MTNYRMLKPDELVQEGDEFYFGQAWQPSGNWPGPQGDFQYRRSLPDEAEELTAADVEADGWIGWPGGEWQGDPNLIVEVEYESGQQSFGPAFHHDWCENDGNRSDDETVQRYREVRADQPAEPVSDEQADAVIREAVQITEKQRRVYYQDIVYKVCSFIDSKIGGSTVCGTVENPTSEVADRLAQAWKEAVLIVEADQPAKPEKPPQPGWAINQFNDIGWRTIGPDGIVFLNEDGDSFEGFNVENIEYTWEDAPDCDGFRWTPLPEQTPAENRLAKAGLKYEGGERYSATSGHRTELLVITTEQAEAMIAHKLERSGQ